MVFKEINWAFNEHLYALLLFVGFSYFVLLSISFVNVLCNVVFMVVRRVVSGETEDGDVLFSMREYGMT